MSLELKYLRSDLLELAGKVNTKPTDESIQDVCKASGRLGGLLDAIELIDERLKHIEISNNINQLLEDE